MAAWFSLFHSFALAGTPRLISVGWLAKHLNRRNLIVLDVRTFSQYEQGHIPRAVKAFGPWQTENKDFLGFMTPPVSNLVDMLRSFGVKNDSFIVIYDAGVTADDTAKSARALWTLEYLGHTKVAILNGGYEAWKQAGMATTTAAEAPDRGNFTAKIKVHKLVSLNEVNALLLTRKATFVDMRDLAEYIGHEKKEYIPKYGHLKGALPLPASYLTIGGHNFSPSFLRTQRELMAIARGISLPRNKSRTIVVYSNHGTRAALGYYVFHDILGYKDVRLYDGSMLEAASDDSVPIARYSWGYYE